MLGGGDAFVDRFAGIGIERCGREFRAGLDAELGEPRHDGRIRRPSGIVHQQFGKPPEELLSRHLEHLRGNWRFGVHTRLDRHAGRRRVLGSCALPLRQRNQLVLILNLVDGVIVRRSTGVCPSAECGQACVDVDLFETGGDRALVVRAYEGKVAALAVVRTGSGRGRHVVPRVDDLHDPPALARIGGTTSTIGSAARSTLRQRIQRVHVHPDDLVVLGIGEFAVVVELVEWRPSSFRLGDVCLGIRLDGDVHQRQPEDVAFLRDGLGFSRRELGLVNFLCLFVVSQEAYFSRMCARRRAQPAKRGTLQLSNGSSLQPGVAHDVENGHEAARIADPAFVARSMERKCGVTAMRARQLYRGRQPAFVLVQVRRPRVQGCVLRAAVLAGTLEIMPASDASTEPANRTFAQYELAM